MWRILDGVAHHAPSQADSTRLLLAVARTLPCIYCRQSFLEFIRRAPTPPPPFSTREALRRWISDRHNDVNRKLGKPVWVDGPSKRPPSMEEVRCAMEVFLLAVAYNFPTAPPDDTKADDVYQLWKTFRDTLGRKPQLISMLHALPPEEALASRERMTEWTLKRLSADGMWCWNRGTADALFDRMMRAQTCSAAQKGCV